MAKKVLALDNKLDVIRFHMDYLLEAWETKKHPVKKSKDNTTFKNLSLDPDEYGILWFTSSDYANLLADDNYRRFMFPDHKRVLGLTFDGTLPYEEVLEQGKELIDKLELELPEQVYLKVSVNSDTDLSKVISSAKEELGLLSRVQLAFNTETHSIPRIVSEASKAFAIGRRHDVSVNSCSLPQFNDKNPWIGNDPCVSAFTMQKLLDTPMVKRPDTFNEGSCMCHKYVNFSGCGELYDASLHKIAKEKAKSRSGY